MQCGAKTRSGEPCKSKAMPNGRCRMHGGSTPETNQNARKHGIYSTVLTDKEKELWDDVRIGNLEDEVRVLKLQLVRALEYKDENGERRMDVIEKLTARIGNLEKTHAEVSQGGDTETDWEEVGRNFASLAEAMGTSKAAPGTD